MNIKKDSNNTYKIIKTSIFLIKYADIQLYVCIYIYVEK